MANALGRWAKDLISHDEQIAEKPQNTLRDLSAVIEHMTADERKRNLEQLRAVSVIYFQGRHNMDFPPEFKHDLKALEKRAERLNEVDTARATLQKLGGPPTIETIYESLERSEKARAISHARAPRHEVVQAQGMEASVGYS